MHGTHAAGFPDNQNPGESINPVPAVFQKCFRLTKERAGASELTPTMIGNTDTVVFDLSITPQPAPTIEIRVSFHSAETIQALDWAIRYNETMAVFDSLYVTLSGVQYLYYYNPFDSTLRFTSNSIIPMPPDSGFVILHFTITSGLFCSGDLFDMQSWLNGDSCSVDLINCNPTNVSEHPEPELHCSLGPVPTREVIKFIAPETGQIVFISPSGQVMHEQEIFRGETTIDLSGWKTGVYFVSFTTAASRWTGKAIRIN